MTHLQSRKMTFRPGFRTLVLLPLLLTCLCGFADNLSSPAAATRQQACSPNGKITMEREGGGYVVRYLGETVLEIPDAGFGEELQPLTISCRIDDDYRMLAGKRLSCSNKAFEYTAGDMVVRIYNDGIAFRYEHASTDEAQERTTYRIADGTRRWMMTWNDAYEGFYNLTTKGEDGRWAFPALTEPAEGVFVLLTEAGMEHGQSASCLYSEGERYHVVPDAHDTDGVPAGHMPWRVAIIGSLADVVESTLVTDVSLPCQLSDTEWIKPGTVSWIYWAHNHGSNDYGIICQYVDMAVALHLPYVLIDAEWDEMKDGKTIEDALAYAHSRGVKPMIWYNSSVGWVNGAPGPKYRLNKAEDREREFAWCEKMGVAGVKIDFFSGDTQKNIDYCLDLLECAARHHLLVNFHGATIPRGWQRTWPNLLTTEAVYGAEWYNNVPTFTNKAARHNATLPFTRNVIGPMDYTPCTFSDSQHPHITTHAHELALTVLYESGLQHLADRPESYLSQPLQVQQFLAALPTVWDETHLIGGYPGEYAVMARRSGETWYVAGINGTDSALTVTLNHSFDFGNATHVLSFTDSGSADNHWHIADIQQLPQTITLLPRGGCVFVLNTKH